MAVRKDTIQLSIEINGAKAGQTYKDLRNNARDLTRELDKLTPGTEAFVRKAAELKTVNTQLAAVRNATRGVGAGLDEAGKRVNPFVDILKKGAVAAVAFFSVQKLIQWTKEFASWATKGTASLEAMQRKSAVVFGDSIDLVEDFAAVNAQALGVTEEKYVSLAAAIGDILIPMGFQRTEAAKLSTDLVNLSGALSEWSNGQRSAEEVSRILAKALTGERESLKELGIVITEAEVSSRLLAKGQKELTGQALQQAKALISYELILEKSKDAQDSFMRNQDGIARASSRLRAAWEAEKERILSGLIPAWSKLLNKWADASAPLSRLSDRLRAQQQQFNVYVTALNEGKLTEERQIEILNELNSTYKLTGESTLTLANYRTKLRDVEKEINAQLETQIKLEAARELLIDARDKKRNAVKAKNEAVVATIVSSKELDKVEALAENNRRSALVKFAEIWKRFTVQRKKDREEDAALAIENANIELEAAKEVALQSGLSLEEINKLLAGIKSGSVLGDGGDGGDGAAAKKLSFDKLAFDLAAGNIEKLKDQRIAANELIVQSDEESAIKRQIIELDAQQELERKRLEIFKTANNKEERLTIAEQEKLQQTILEHDTRRIELNGQLTLQSATELIEQKRALTIAALDEEALTEEAHGRRLEIINKQFDISIHEAKMQQLSVTSEAYVQAQRDLADKLKDVDKLILADTIAQIEEGLRLREELAVDALDALHLEEVDYNTARERIALETDIEILKSRITLYKANSAERLALEKELADKVKELSSNTFFIPDEVASTGGFSTPDDGEDRKKKLEKITDAALDATSQLASSQLAIEGNRIDQQLELELNALDELTERKLAAAEGDSVLQKKITAQAAKEREELEKKAAKRRKDLAIKEAIIQIALSVIEALPDAVAAIAAGVLGAIQLGVIKSQSFFKGGDTGSKGLYTDRDGHKVAGVVHTDEYVVPSTITKDPAYKPVLSYLERVRREKGGYAEGGYTTLSTRPAEYVQTVTSTSSMPELREVIDVLNDIRQITAAWPTVIKAVMAYTDFERTRDTVEGIRAQSRG